MKKIAIALGVAASLGFSSLAVAQDVRGRVDASDGNVEGRARVSGERGDGENWRDSGDDRRNYDSDDSRRDRREYSRDDRRDRDSRMRFYNGRWWYRGNDGGWLYWYGNRWNPYYGNRYAGTRNYGGTRYYGSPNYYDDGYYDRGYYNDGYRYGAGYRGYDDRYYGGYGSRYGYGYSGPGYGNRGWGNYNYGGRDANRGSNVGGMIDQGLGGSGWLGAEIGGAVSR